MEILPPLPASTAPSESAQATQSLTKNFDTFLLMLTTQLSHQDPLSPTDTNEFTNQLVQFSQLEQQISQTGKIDDMIALQQSAEGINAINYLDKTVEVQADVTLLENGEAKFSYIMPEGVKNAKIAILDSSGQILTTFDADKQSGRHEAVWDGKNAQGVLQADGPYTVVVSAVDANDVPFDEIPVFFTGVADAVWQHEGETFVTVGPLEVPLERILTIKPTETPPTA